MKKILLFVFSLFITAPVLATETWTAPAAATGYETYTRVSKAACTTGTESAAQLAATSGISTVGLGSVTVYMEITSGTTTAGKLLAYVVNPATGNWVPMPDLDLTVPAGITTSYAWPGWKWDAPGPRLAYLPSAVGTVVSSIYVNGFMFRGGK